MFRSILYKTSVHPTNVSVRFISTPAYTEALGLLKQDLKRAMLAKDDLKKTTIRSILSTIKNKEIDIKDKDLDEFMLFDVYSKMIAQRKDSISEFKKNNREELAAKEQQEMDVIAKYVSALPVASREEIDAQVLEFLTELKKSEPSLQMKQIFGRVDWKTYPSQLKASPAAIKASIVSQFKSVFQ